MDTHMQHHCLLLLSEPMRRVCVCVCVHLTTPSTLIRCSGNTHSLSLCPSVSTSAALWLFECVFDLMWMNDPWCLWLETSWSAPSSSPTSSTPPAATTACARNTCISPVPSALPSRAPPRPRAATTRTPVPRWDCSSSITRNTCAQSQGEKPVVWFTLLCVCVFRAYLVLSVSYIATDALRLTRIISCVML